MPPPPSHPNPTTNTTQLPQNINTARHDHKLLQQPRRRHSSSSSIKSSQIGAELKAKAASTPAKPRKSSSDLRGVRGGRQKSFHLSDLDTDSESYSHPEHDGGVNHIHVLSSSTETSDFDRAADDGGGGGKMSKKRRTFEEKIKKRSSGLFTHTHQFGKHGGIQLLRLEPFDRDIGHTGKGGQLEQEFPGLAKALKQFNDSVAPRSQHFASKTQPAATIKNMPLLQLSNVPEQAPHLAPPPFHVLNPAPRIPPPTQQPPLQQARPQSSSVGGKIPMPLLIIPNQPPTLSTIQSLQVAVVTITFPCLIQHISPPQQSLTLLVNLISHLSLVPQHIPLLSKQATFLVHHILPPPVLVHSTAVSTSSCLGYQFVPLYRFSYPHRPHKF